MYLNVDHITCLSGVTQYLCVHTPLCVCVCVIERERERGGIGA